MKSFMVALIPYVFIGILWQGGSATALRRPQGEEPSKNCYKDGVMCGTSSIVTQCCEGLVCRKNATLGEYNYCNKKQTGCRERLEKCSYYKSTKCCPGLVCKKTDTQGDCPAGMKFCCLAENEKPKCKGKEVQLKSSESCTHNCCNGGHDPDACKVTTSRCSGGSTVCGPGKMGESKTYYCPCTNTLGGVCTKDSDCCESLKEKDTYPQCYDSRCLIISEILPPDT